MNETVKTYANMRARIHKDLLVSVDKRRKAAEQLNCEADVLKVLEVRMANTDTTIGQLLDDFKAYKNLLDGTDVWVSGPGQSHFDTLVCLESIMAAELEELQAV